jgi:hypothetical protein
MSSSVPSARNSGRDALMYCSVDPRVAERARDATRRMSGVRRAADDVECLVLDA